MEHTLCAGSGKYPISATRDYLVDRACVPAYRQPHSHGSGNASHGRCIECNDLVQLDTWFRATDHYHDNDGHHVVSDCP